MSCVRRAGSGGRQRLTAVLPRALPNTADSDPLLCRSNANSSVRGWPMPLIYSGRSPQLPTSTSSARRVRYDVPVRVPRRSTRRSTCRRAKEPQFFATDLDSGSYLESVSVHARRRPLPGAVRGGKARTADRRRVDLVPVLEESPRPTSRPSGRMRGSSSCSAHPVQMLYSLHGRRYYARLGGHPDFTEALAAEEDRRNGRRIPPEARNVTALFSTAPWAATPSRSSATWTRSGAIR